MYTIVYKKYTHIKIYNINFHDISMIILTIFYDHDHKFL